MRHLERESDDTIPPEVRPAAVRVEPATNDATVHVQQVRNAVGVVDDGLVHGNDAPQPHCSDLLVRELQTDEAGQFGVRYDELALVGRSECFRIGANLLRSPPVVVLEEHALENGDFSRHAGGRLEVRAAEYLFGVVADAEVIVFQTLDPVLASRAVGGDREVDDAVLFAPRTDRFENRDLAAKGPIGSLLSTRLVHDGFKPIEAAMAILRHHILLFG